eukprot:2108784-Amphidinium_carterae.1
MARDAPRIQSPVPINWLIPPLPSPNGVVDGGGVNNTYISADVTDLCSALPFHPHSLPNLCPKKIKLSEYKT